MSQPDSDIATTAPRSAPLPQGDGSHAYFDPAPYREALVAIIREIEELAKWDSRALDQVLRKYPRDGKGFFSRAQIIAGFRAFAGTEDFASDESTFLQRVQRRPVRSQSGVLPLTVLTQPFPCPGKCVYCPNDLRMPKSYLRDEPGAQRAANNHFDPYLQSWNRLAALRAIGHATAKIELIVLGGTWSFYPEAYQVWFVSRCIQALNDFGAGVDGRDAAREGAPGFGDLGGHAPAVARSGSQYNRVVSDLLRVQGVDARSSGSADWQGLADLQVENESATCRNVGISLETRPDYVSEEEVLRLRRLGCTKVQLGLQSLSDVVLSAIRRGHELSHTRRAIGLLRRAGFKIHAHWMPNLPASDPQQDLVDYDRMFDDPDFRPDELKIYPCSLIESAELMDFYRDGRWRPYSQDELLQVVSGVIERTPRYCRLTRVIRDISSDDIVVGNKLTNFREIAEREVLARGGGIAEIRSREIRDTSFVARDLELLATAYESGVGREVFLEFVTPDDAIVAFLRLALPSRASFIEELGDQALIREVHVYGSALEIGAEAQGRAQHRGLGGRLIEEAAGVAREAGFETLSVISAIGTRAYYRRLGFRDGTLYQHLAI